MSDRESRMGGTEVHEGIGINLYRNAVTVYTVRSHPLGSGREWLVRMSVVGCIHQAHATHVCTEGIPNRRHDN